MTERIPDDVRAIAAAPDYAVGTDVFYRDRQNREQCGQVLAIEAKWTRWSSGGGEPYLIYTLWHPTYRSNRFYAGPTAILSSEGGGE